MRSGAHSANLRVSSPLRAALLLSFCLHGGAAAVFSLLPPAEFPEARSDVAVAVLPLEERMDRRQLEERREQARRKIDQFRDEVRTRQRTNAKHSAERAEAGEQKSFEDNLRRRAGGDRRRDSDEAPVSSRRGDGVRERGNEMYRPGESDGDTPGLPGDLPGRDRGAPGGEGDRIERRGPPGGPGGNPRGRARAGTGDWGGPGAGGSALVAAPLPVYPERLQQRAVTGQVRVKVFFLPDGRVYDVKVLSYADAELAAATREAVWKWRANAVSGNSARHLITQVRFVLE